MLQGGCWAEAERSEVDFRALTPGFLCQTGFSAGNGQLLEAMDFQ
jgi:hypothetical protein